MKLYSVLNMVLIVTTLLLLSQKFILMLYGNWHWTLQSFKCFFVLGHQNASHKNRTRRARRKEINEALVRKCFVLEEETWISGSSSCNEQIVSFKEQQMCHGKLLKLLWFCEFLTIIFVVFPYLLAKLICIRAKHIFEVSAKFIFPPRSSITLSNSNCSL